MRVFAGPNGSGKSTLKPMLRDYNLGVYVNADEIARQYSEIGFLDLDTYGFQADVESIRLHFRSGLASRQQITRFNDSELALDGSLLRIGSYRQNNYCHAILADYIRLRLLDSGATFSYETVLSHPSKIDFMRQAVASGYRTYLYYVATEDPEINKSRVKNRVLSGLHDVPEDKIVSRYYKSLDLLIEAIKASSRSFIFDNSGAAGQQYLIASSEGNDLVIENPRIPAWFDFYVLSRLRSQST